MDTSLVIRNRARSLRKTMTLPEILLWQGLRGRRLGGLRFRREHPIGPFILDFFCPQARLAVEVDGESHGYTVAQDERRDLWLREQGIRVLRLVARDILESVEGALVTIQAAASVRPVGVSPLRPSGPLPPEGEDLVHLAAPPLGELSRSD
ncbi:very-short-patch-repair endonuclease [Caulobacter ginsengisoli]|uniref:Very-short-patch-repair endonuclease n=1 Tax=Caulobacter ginsengisoli TaxID=400775 RepID=A0ABU0IM14_9CAUL|nr:endonuclease domain-containing protein [Caulobacter ginsengisoli]MDQ0462421.1 very-short-patch-repair endonuclease [Caulobacter ginsengisoli]